MKSLAMERACNRLKAQAPRTAHLVITALARQHLSEAPWIGRDMALYGLLGLVPVEAIDAHAARLAKRYRRLLDRKRPTRTLAKRIEEELR